jgi:tRNA-splicing ligase RtcB
MPATVLKGSKVPIHLWADPREVESVALDQLKRIAALPWVYHHVAAMPDVHFGKGATIGSVIAMRGAVAPSAVGVDMGCGMAAMRLDLRADDLPDDLGPMRTAIERAVPVGFAMHAEPLHEGDRLWREFDQLSGPVKDLFGRARRQLGTLGGGNHFIELCLDTEGGVWIMLHSGSRRVGLVLAEHHMAIARKLAHNAQLPDPDLAVLLEGTPQMAAYRRDLDWAQRYAAANREAMLRLVRGAVAATLRRDAPVLRTVRCHHNYVAEELHYGEVVLVTRKGAIRAGAGEWGIIPGSMGTGSYIVQGLGSAESYESAAHGAGRRMSRSRARKTFSLADLEAQTAGVFSRKDAGVIDEIPGAYKDVAAVMAAQSDLVEVKARLKQVLCVKG